jgi:hypothetical protein
MMAPVDQELPVVDPDDAARVPVAAGLVEETAEDCSAKAERQLVSLPSMTVNTPLWAQVLWASSILPMKTYLPSGKEMGDQVYPTEAGVEAMVWLMSREVRRSKGGERGARRSTTLLEAELAVSAAELAAALALVLAVVAALVVATAAADVIVDDAAEGITWFTFLLITESVRL